MFTPDPYTFPPRENGPRVSDIVLSPRWQTACRRGTLALTLAVLAFIALNCIFNPNIRFLSPGPGKWIIYPFPPDLQAFPGIELTGTFRRSFVLPEKPGPALLSWRCLTNGEVYVNGTFVLPEDSTSESWKSTSQADIGPSLRQGSNEISVIVANQAGPPALSLKLKSGSFLLKSDESWEVSVSGSNWRMARAASATPKPEKGNELYLLETTGGALRRCWPLLCLFAAISVCGVVLLQHYIGRATSSGSSKTIQKIILVTLGSVWVLLFVHNFPFTPAADGFDASSHLQYVRYIEHNQALPSASEGWEMFQPPLYYIISAILLGICHYDPFQSGGMMLLRYLSLTIGAANLALIYTGLRLFFPGDWKKPLAGLVLAAFLPAQIYLLHYTTNETLSAMLVTASLCLGLYLLRAKQFWWGWHGILGIVLGLALLSKVSALLAVPVVLGVLIVNLILRRVQVPPIWVDAIGTPLLICLFLGGWHFMKLWHDFGNPFTGNWNPKVFAPWWQEKGYQTPGYFFSFGDSLVRPFCSGLHSFWDGFYSTLWGDGLMGGHTNLSGRPPWNYDLMAVGFVLALVPTALVVTGLVHALAGCIRSITLPWLLMMTVGWLFTFAILSMSFKVPSYAQTKAFYGLPVLLPFCVLGALGFEFWAGRGKMVRNIMCVALGIWLVNVYASFWIRPNTIEGELSAAVSRMSLNEDPSKDFLNILNQHPGDSQATIWLASLESKEHPDQAIKRLEQAIKDHPANAQIESALAQTLALSNRLDEAIVHIKHAAALSPEDERAFKIWCSLDVRHKNYEEALVAGRTALSLNPTDLDTHLQLGIALMNLRQIPEAISHFSPIIFFQTTRAEAEFNLGRCLLMQPDKRDEGIAHLGAAVQLDPTNTVWQTELKNALKGP